MQYLQFTYALYMTRIMYIPFTYHLHMKKAATYELPTIYIRNLIFTCASHTTLTIYIPVNYLLYVQNAFYMSYLQSTHNT
jgi:hypothetical protein